MKGFFELIGFFFTALITGVAVFLYVGHKKNEFRKETTTVYAKVSESGIEDEMETKLAAPKPVSKTPVKRAEASLEPVFNLSATSLRSATKPVVTEKKKAPNTEVAPVAEVPKAVDKLKGLYEDEVFVKGILKKWQKKVATTAQENDIRASFLMANVIAKSYLGLYDAKDFARDVAQHTGDSGQNEAEALRYYENSAALAQLSKRYELSSYFAAKPLPKVTPVKMTKPVAVAKTKEPAAKRAVGASFKPLPESVAKTVVPSSKKAMTDKGFREMVAKEEGFDTWQGLQLLGDIETKKRAEKRVKALASVALVR